MLHLFTQPNRLLHPSPGPWCCPRWEGSGSSDPRSPTPGRCRWRGLIRPFGLNLLTRRSVESLALWVSGGCWSRSRQCSLEECLPARGPSQEPRPSGSYRRWILCRYHSTPVPAPSLARLFSVDGKQKERNHLYSQTPFGGRFVFPHAPSYLLVGIQLFLQLLCLFSDDPQVVLHRLSGVHTAIKSVV